MRYAIAQHRREQEDKAYRVYVTDAVRIITENTAASVNGKFFTGRFVDIWEPQKEEPKKSCKEITDDIIARCGLVVK